MPDQFVRFTPEELKELAPSLTPEDLMKMHPDDRKIALSLTNNIAQGPSGNLQKIDPNGGWKALGAMGAGLAGGLAGGASGLASKVIPYGKMAGHTAAMGLGAIGAQKAAEYFGASKSMSDLIPLLVLMAGGGKGGGKAAAAAELSEEEKMVQEIVKKSGTSPEIARDVVARMKAAEAAAPQKGSTGVGIVSKRMPQVSKQDAIDAEKRVFGSEAAAAEARTFGSSPKAAYPSNIKTESNDADLKEMLTRSSSKGSPSPLMFHDDPDNEFRKAIEALKKQVSRRSPGQ